MSELPLLTFFKQHPARVGEEYVAGALQGFETALLLIALRRYPNALTVLGSALESMLQAAPIGAKERDGLQDLLKKAARLSPAFQDWNQPPIEEFKELRNRFVHRGFSPRDDQTSVRHILVAGMPLFYAACEDFLGFSVRDSLFEEYGWHLEVAREVLHDADELGTSAEEYCFNGFAALIRWSMRESFASAWELAVLEGADSDGTRFQLMRSQRERFQRQYPVEWACDCPVCRDIGALAVALDERELNERVVRALAAHCSNCGFVTLPTERLLAVHLLGEQLKSDEKKILAEYGLGG